MKLAQDAGVANINLDLMYALPGQDLAMALHDVERAVALQPQHLSHYQLTLEPNTVFAAKPPAGIPAEDAAWDMQERCIEAMADAGYAQYEVSAYAQPGRQCAHNLNYWRFGDYLGIGAGAHGKLSLGASGEIRRRWKLKNPRDYLAGAGTPARDRRRRLARAGAAALRLHAQRVAPGRGLRARRFRGAHRPAARGDRGSGCERARERGWLDVGAERVTPTELGRRFTNDVISLFLE